MISEGPPAPSTDVIATTDSAQEGKSGNESGGRTTKTTETIGKSDGEIARYILLYKGIFPHDFPLSLEFLIPASFRIAFRCLLCYNRIEGTRPSTPTDNGRQNGNGNGKALLSE